MNEPRYKIIFQGQLATGQNKDAVNNRLARVLKTDEKTLEPLFDGDKWLIRNNVRLEIARQYETAFANAGAQCIIEPLAPSPEQETDTKKAEFEFFSFENYSFAPAVLSMPKLNIIKGRDDNAVLYFSSKRPVVGKFFAFMIGAIIAIIGGYYLFPPVTERLGTDLKVSVLLMFSYFVCIYILYSILTGRKHIVFYSDSLAQDIFMKIISKRIFKIGYDSYAVLNEKGEKIGILKKDGYSHICKSYDDSGACAGIAQKHAEMNETAMSAIFSFRERIVDSKILDFLQAIIEKSLRSVISGIVDSETFDAVQGFLEKDAPRFLIRSEKDETIAVCSIGKTCDLTIFDTEDNDTDKRLVIGLSFLVSGL